MSLPTIQAQHDKLLDLLHSLLPASIQPQDKFDPRHFQRNRTFTVDFLAFTLLYLISDQNNFGYQHILETLWQELRTQKMVDDSDPAPRKSSLCKARRKLPAKYIKDMFTRTIQKSRQLGPKRLWKGRRLFAIDGTTVTLPRSKELKQAFGCHTSKEGEAHYPQALLVELFNVLTDEVCEFTLSPVNTSERKQALLLLDQLEAGDIVLEDRGYPSWALFWEHQKRGVDFITRMLTNKPWPVVQKFLASGKRDQRVVLPMSKKARQLYKNDPSVPKSLTIRLIRLTLKTGKIVVLATSLLSRKKYPAKEIREIYPQCWPVEEGNKSLKCHQVIEKFHAKDVNGIYQEVNAHYLLMAITRLLMLQAATPAPQKYYGLSYKSAVDFVSNNLVRLILIIDKGQKGIAILDVSAMIASLHEQPRYNRSYPRRSRSRANHPKYQQRDACPTG